LPDLPYAAYRDTSATLQIQLSARLILRKRPQLNYFWHVALYLSPRGLWAVGVRSGTARESSAPDCERHPFGSMVEEIVATLGPLSGFVHSAGISFRLPLKLTRPEHFEQTLAVNVISAFELAKHVQQKANLAIEAASFVFIASIMGHLGQPAKIAYCASKAALVNGARALALELAPRHIRVNCVSPGVVKTKMYESLVKRLPEGGAKSIVDAHPLGFGEASDVASAVAFLLSDASRWITGTDLIVDGGYSAQ
jgi:NAD(P)-dependent dehydrogenase (short-subunit alcohol dehydrogenase family)